MNGTRQVRLRYAAKLFLSHLLAVFLVSGSIGTFFYLRAMDSLLRNVRSRLKNSAALLSQSIDARTLDGIRSVEDTGAAVYLETLDKLRRMRRTNPDISFLYIMRKEADRVVFVVDSDETSAQAQPGRVYPDVPPLMEAGFHDPTVDDDLVEDEWGVFLSGYAPLLQGGGRYLVGIDMRADEVMAKLAELRMTGLISLLASILLALLFAHVLSRGLTRRIGVLAAHCRRMTAGRFDARVEGRTFDEFDDLTEAFNTMSESLGETREALRRPVANLETARDELESRVGARTRDLQEALDRVNVLKGLLPICSHCKKIRDDKGYWTQVEQFVARHSGAKFTHGICPECAIELYDELLTHPAGSGSDAPDGKA